MIELLDELTEIPFVVFWEKFKEMDPYPWDKSRSQTVWFSMKEEERIAAFKHLCVHGNIGGPYVHLKSFKK